MRSADLGADVVGARLPTQVEGAAGKVDVEPEPEVDDMPAGDEGVDDQDKKGTFPSRLLRQLF